MQQPDLLRLVTMGSVDDGKSTLLGRLLLDANALPPDQLSAAETHSRSRGDEYLDLALLTDGLKAEREQGITIDVAYRYFSTPKRRFILADCPGHVQYTRNLFTGASTAEAAVILIDARKGLVEQTRRHLYIASLLRLQQVLVCINKMDLVAFSQDVFQEIVHDAEKLVKQLGLQQVQYLPVSALKGDNVVKQSEQMPWFTGEPLLPLLEKLPKNQEKFTGLRLPVQQVVRPQSEILPDFRGYAGALESGKIKAGQQVKIMPSGFTTYIKSIYVFEQELQEAEAPQAVVVTL
ncbi:MAG: GTP-binding protein, partial [Hymenobacteraceae bacterium]|nr:GTP-binding protein [Hymenobacteraceae bacterium]MDX5513434.1 GTP-binding protein [Hymenobacteraceae bacterium]